jgi:dihydroorotase
LSDIEGLHAAGVRFFTDDGDSVRDGSLVREVMERIARLDGAVLSQHAEDPSMTRGGHMHECGLSRQLGIGGLPVEAETGVVRRDLRLVRETGAAYHCQHVSAAETVAVIRTAKEEGLPVTAEVTPHHLSFEVSSLTSLDPNMKMYPPIRSEADRVSLEEGLRDGTIDVVATDHAPHSVAEKSVAFEDAPRGVIGLETAASATLEAIRDPVRLFQVMSLNPALIGGLSRQGRPIVPGEAANLVVFDPEVEWLCDAFVSKSQNSPYRGRVMRGRAKATIYEGEIVHHLEGVR